MRPGGRGRDASRCGRAAAGAATAGAVSDRCYRAVAAMTAATAESAPQARPGATPQVRPGCGRKGCSSGSAVAALDMRSRSGGQRGSHRSGRTGQVRPAGTNGTS